MTVTCEGQAVDGIGKYWDIQICLKQSMFFFWTQNPLKIISHEF